MKFLTLELENLRTFVKPVRLPLADLGLVVIRGDNRVSASCTDNGVGKTGLLHGLSWALFGKDLDGAGAADVACRFNDAPGRAELCMDGGWRIERHCRPTDLLVFQNGVCRDKGEAEQAIQDALGWGWQTFRTGVVFGQGGLNRFAAAAQSDKMKLFDEMLGMDFRVPLDRAKAWRDDWSRRLDDALAEAGEFKAVLERDLVQIYDLENAFDEFKTGKASRLKAAEAVLDRVNREVVDPALKAVDAVKERAKEARRLREKWDRAKALQAEVDKLLRAHDGAEILAAQARDEVTEVGGEVENLVHEGGCPTCLRPIKDKTEIERVRKLFAPRLKAAQVALKAAATTADAAQERVQEASAVLERHVKAIPGVDERVVARAEMEGGLAAVERSRAQLEQAYRQRTEAQAALKAERDRAWEGQAALDAARRQYATSVAGLEENEKAQKKARLTVAAAEYWVEAFGDRGIRALMFESNADFLNARLSAHLETLTAGEAVAAFSALEELKKGGARERLNLLAEWDWGAKGYKPASEGQKQRLNLAVFLALQDVSEQRSARPWPLRAWDEPEAHLDERGREMFCAWVAREARARGTGLLITHSSEVAAMLEPDSTWTVVLEKTGARVEID